MPHTEATHHGANAPGDATHTRKRPTTSGDAPGDACTPGPSRPVLARRARSESWVRDPTAAGTIPGLTRCRGGVCPAWFRRCRDDGVHSTHRVQPRLSVLNRVQPRLSVLNRVQPRRGVARSRAGIVPPGSLALRLGSWWVASGGPHLESEDYPAQRRSSFVHPDMLCASAARPKLSRSGPSMFAALFFLLLPGCARGGLLCCCRRLPPAPIPKPWFEELLRAFCTPFRPFSLRT
jgi:hypothetical protein